MKITIIGAGPGGPQWMSHIAYETLQRADICIGAQRLLEYLPGDIAAIRCEATTPEEIARLIMQQRQAEQICILVSGDAGFYSVAKKLLPLLQGYEVSVFPGISSMQMLAAALGRPWQDWHLASAHGRDCNAAVLVRDHAETFFLTGGEHTVRRICRDLYEAGFGGYQAVVGCRLGGAGEAIYADKVETLAGRDHDPLAVLLVKNPQPRRLASCGFADDRFIRGEAPMTKSEVRAIALSKLCLNIDDTVYDVGAGTGSLAVEAALLVRCGRVYAIERSEDNCRLIEDNARRFAAANLMLVAAEAPAAFSGLPAPDAAFIGGSGGKLPQILAELLRLNPTVKLVISAVTLETLSAATATMKELPITEVEIVQVAVSRARVMGGHHLLLAQNPVFLISGVGKNG